MSELEDIWHEPRETDLDRRRRYMAADPEMYRGTCPICFGEHLESEHKTEKKDGGV